MWYAVMQEQTILKLALDFLERFHRLQAPLYKTYKKVLLPLVKRFYESMSEQQIEEMYKFFLRSPAATKISRNSLIVVKQKKEDYIEHYEDSMLRIGNISNGLQSQYILM